MQFALPLFVFFFGTAVGSFVNVAVFRAGFSERASPRSHCRSCDAPLPWYDLIPILSFVALGGRCRACGSRISLQYPVVEFGVGLAYLFALFAAPPALSAWSLAAFAALLVFIAAFAALVAYDLRHFLVPAPFSAALAVSALAAALFQSAAVRSFAPALDSLLGGASLFLFFMLIVAATRGKGMGAGDAYVAGAIGLLFGFSRGAEAVMFAVWSGAAVGLLLLALSSFFGGARLFGNDSRVTMKTALPLVPFLAFGAALALYTDFSPLALAARFTDFFLSGHS